MESGAVSASANVALTFVAALSFWLAWKAGIFAERIESTKRKPQIGYSLQPLPLEEAQRALPAEKQRPGI